MKRINIKELIKNKKYVLIIGIIAFILLAVGATYAYFNWSSSKINTVVSSRCFEIFYEKGNDIEGEIMPSYDYTGGLYSVAKMDINSLCNLDAIGKLYLDVSEETSTNLYREGLLNYQVLKNGELTDIKGSITSAGEIELYLGKLNRNLSATTEYTIYVWIDYDLVNNNDVGSKFIGSIRGEAIQGFEVASGEVMLTENGVTYGGQLIANVGEIDTEEEVVYSYQWYTNTTASNSGGVPIAGATTDTLNLTEETIDQYVYCAVTMSIKNMLPRTVASPVTSTKVSKKNLTITPNAQTVTYGTPISNSINDIGVTGLAFGDRIATGSITQNKTTAGTGTMSASGVTIVDSEGNDVTANYNLSYSAGALTINKKDASITPSAQTITYGDSITSTNDKVSVTGLLATDSLSSVSLSQSTVNAGTGTVNVSSVSIKNSSGTDVTGSYNITNNTGVLTVNKKAATVTASAQTITYGSSITKGTSKIGSSGIVSGDSVSAVTLTASRSTAGTGTITPSSATIKNSSGTDVTSNYSITYNTGNLTVNKKAVTITASAQTITYGGSITNGTSKITTSGLVSGHEVSAVTLTASRSTAGTGTITPSSATINNSSGTDVTSNYSITYNTGTLTINKAVMTGGSVSISGTLQYGYTLNTNNMTSPTKPSAVGVTYAWYANDTKSTTGGTKVGSSSTLTLTSSSYGKYIYVVVTFTDPAGNYSDKTVTSEVTSSAVAKRAITVISNSASKTYDGTALKNSGCSLKSGSTTYSSHSLSCSTSGSITNVGTTSNTITAKVVNSSGTDVSTYYSITKEPGTLTVNKKAATITAHDMSLVYGKIQSLKFSGAPNTVDASGLLSDHTVEVVRLTLTRLDVGQGSVTPSAATIIDSSGTDVTSNYSISYKAGALNIARATCSCDWYQSGTATSPVASLNLGSVTSINRTVYIKCTGIDAQRVTITKSGISSSVSPSTGSVPANGSLAINVRGSYTGSTAAYIYLTIKGQVGTNYAACSGTQLALRITR